MIPSGIRKRIGLPWRLPSACAHPPDRRRSRYFHPEPWTRVLCRDCGVTVEIVGQMASPTGRRLIREPFS